MKKTLIIVTLLFVYLSANENIKEYIYSNEKKVMIVCFYTSWCPACKKSIELLNEMQKEYKNRLHILAVNLDDGVKREAFVDESNIEFKIMKATKEEAEQYGLKDSIPFMIVKNRDSITVKKFHETPNRDYFFKLIQRLNDGYLENGTLPVQMRVDLWKSKRE